MTAGLVEQINEALAKHAVALRISQADITVTDQTVSDFAKPAQHLSLAVIDKIWPSVPTIEVDHYTTRSAAEAIVSSNLFRLTNLAKRVHEDEIRTFCVDHNLDGYLQINDSGQPAYRELMENTFYGSFTDRYQLPEEAQYFWDTFTGDDGVRLTFRVTASNPNFRQIRYQQQSGVPISLLDDLFKIASQNGDRKFILSGISRLCSFYLKGGYRKELEYRMLHRLWGEELETNIRRPGNGEATYVEIPIGGSGAFGFSMDLIAVCSDSPLRSPISCPYFPRPPAAVI